MKSTLLCLAWVLTAFGMYAGIVALEFCWNVPFWEPVGSGTAWLLIAWQFALLGAFWFLVRAAANRFTRAISLLVCLGLLALAIYIVPAEAARSGLFARPMPSAFWYRGSRSVMLVLPLLFWVIGVARARRDMADKAAVGDVKS